MFISENEINSLISGRDEVWDVLNYALANHDLKYDGAMVLQLCAISFVALCIFNFFPLFSIDLFCVLVLDLSFHLVFYFCW
ncbi:hypothetical protein L6452_08203 [Arctium lappa]|uniref:Uncharacterized protein n=1 Tax=Arctium lappa TaxID=4217 RepID=A0ACB9DGK5_ARCLA|nr:hypothetical protein L6452_08203 [Arctium lappa]